MKNEPEGQNVRGMEDEQLSRGLKNRHIQMIAIGGAIGVGLFYGSSGAISLAGPSVLIAYAITGVAIYFMMRALGEMSVEEPVSGSYVSYGSRYIHPYMGFLLGWNAVLCMAAISTAEYNALGQYIQFWFPDIPIWVSALSVVAFLTAINVISVKIYGETEFWLSIVKVVTICLMIVMGALIIFFGAGCGGKPIGLGNMVNNGGLFPNGMKGFLFSLILTAFAFGGVEFVGTTAGEADDVKKTIPKAIKSVFSRILIFYVGAIFIMLCLTPWNKLGTTGSPFVNVFSLIGIPAAASVINFVVITAAVSSLNGAIYNASRFLYNLSLQGQAPKIFQKTTKKNVPFIPVIIVIAVQLFGVLMNVIIPASAFQIFASIMTFGLVAGWLAILFSELNFRKGKINSGEDKNLSFKMPFWPYSNYFAIFFFTLVVVLMGFMDGTRITLVVAPVWMVVLWIAYMLMEKSKKNLAEIKTKDNSASC